jgi:hypothetical protein
MFLICPEFLACNKSDLLPGLIDSSLATITAKMAPISDAQARNWKPSSKPFVPLTPWRISAIGELYGLFPSLLGKNWHRTNLFRRGKILSPAVFSPGEFIHESYISAGLHRRRPFL